MRSIKVPAFFGTLFLSMFVVALAGFTPALHAQTSAGGTAAGQHWWLCQYRANKDPSQPVLGSVMYYAILPASDSFANDHWVHFNAYVRQNYKIVDLNSSGFCRRTVDTAAGRANTVDGFKKQWASSKPPVEVIQVNYDGTPAQDAGIDAKLAEAASVQAKAAATPTAAANQKYAWCHSNWVGLTGTKLPAGTVLYFSDVFAGTIPPPPSGATTGGKTGNGWAQISASTTFQTPFAAFLQKKYGKNVGVACSATDPPTQAGLQNAQKNRQDFEDMTKKMNGQVVETGWSGQ